MPAGYAYPLPRRVETYSEGIEGYRPRGRGELMVRGQSSSDPQVNDNTPTFPGPVDSSFNLLYTYTFPDWYTVTASGNPTLTTIDFQMDTPFQLDAGQIDGVIQGAVPDLQALGINLLFYEVDEKPLEILAVPDQFCVLGVCTSIPLVGGLQVTGWTYRFYGVYSQPVASGSRAFIPIAIGTAIAVVVLAVTALFVVFALHDLAEGKLSLSGLVDQIGNFVSAPGKIVQPGIQSAEWPLIGLGVLAVVMGVAIPAINVGGALRGPGGVGVEGKFGL